jgi:hypothetical protein
MKALRAMDYLAVSFGRNEIALPLHDALAYYALNNPRPRVVGSNLLGRENKGDPFFGTVAGSAVGAAAGPKVGVLALAGPSLEQDKDIKNTLEAADIKFHRNTPEVLTRALADLKAGGAELVVVLYQGKFQEAEACARYCSGRRQADPGTPPVSVVLCLDDTEGVPPATAEPAGDALVVRVGLRGQYVGVVGAFRTGRPDRPWDLRYQLVQMVPEFKTPPGKEKGHPVMELIEEYALRVKDGDFLGKRAARAQPHPIQGIFKNAEYVGSGECRGCHGDAYKVWKNSKHSHAYEALEKKAKHPSNRQYDPECVACHVVGFGYQTGFKNEKDTPNLKHVGCESCHGPCSPHLENPKDPKIHALINPFKAPPNETPQARQRRENLLDISCQKCHDQDNDPLWRFPVRWADVAHPTPKRGK